MLAESSDSLRKLLGRQIVVPAKTVGLSDAEQSLQGKVVDTNQEENSLWCTVSGDKRWYGTRCLLHAFVPHACLAEYHLLLRTKNPWPELCASHHFQANLQTAQSVAGTAGMLMRSLHGWWNKQTP